jgi:hypothetical protein
MLIVVVAGFLLLIAGRPGTGGADSKRASDADTYNYHGTFNYYYPASSPTPSPPQQPAPPKTAPSSSTSLGWSAAEAISTAVSAILTIGLVLFAYAQWQTAQMEMRAYLFVTNIEIAVPSLNPAYVPQPHLVHDQIVVHVKNAGKTPAYNVAVTVVGLPRQAGSLLPNNFGYPDVGSTTPDFLVATTVIGPDTSHSFPTAPGPAMAQDMPAVRNAELWLYVYGHIDYNDVFYKVRFLKSPKRRTEFCWLYVQGPTPDQYTFQTYKEHNEAT